ncbi:NepR family anti-sigma factor [Cohaesibacter celericrescens]|jgi:hypothetical protein|uniref:NepR family anti-sigma factor n=1 Tax=Cohaesibacter celericrescens TaxID=2067669 RepID=UPI0015E13370|nr:NepR family anti-sigma factor [Cohaesibacter celericrescens]
MVNNNHKRLDPAPGGFDDLLAPNAGGLDPNDAISQKLKALYSQAEQQAIPDRFLDLLEKLDEVERASKPSEEK